MQSAGEDKVCDSSDWETPFSGFLLVQLVLD